jgi:hypothetical protein
MRHVVVTASLCLLTCTSALAADHKPFTERVDSEKSATAAPLPDPSVTETVRDKTPAPELRFAPQPLRDLAAPLTTGMPPFEVLADDAQIEIPQQSGTSALLAPRDLPIPPPAPKPRPKMAARHSTDEICDTVAQAAQNNNLPVPFFIRLLFQESKFKPDAVSHAGAQGIAQIMPKTADAIGLDNPFDPLQAIPASARLLRSLFEKFGNLGLAAAAYNAGPKKIHDWLASKGKLPEETQGYVKTITGQPAETWKKAGHGTAATQLPPRAPCQDAVLVASASPRGAVPVPEERPERTAHAAHRAQVAHAAHRTHVAHAAQKAPNVQVAHQKAKAPKVQVAHAAHPEHGKSTVNLAARRHAPRPGKHRLAMR